MADEEQRTLYGRRQGHALSARQAHLLETSLPRLEIDLQRQPGSLASLFDHDPERIVVEVGFGSGEHLVDCACREPAAGFIGAEAYVNGLASILGTIDDERIANIRLLAGDGAELLKWLPEASVDCLYLCYLDPWRKRRHWKRRFISAYVLDQIARVLKPGATLRFVSDWSTYVTWALMHVRGHVQFAWPANSAEDWREPWPRWPGTRYEAKALREGRKPSYLEFLRV